MHQLRRRSQALLAVSSLGALAACSGSGSGSGSDASDGGGDKGSATRTVPTGHGDVTIPAAPKKIVVLNYALVGFLFNLGVPVAATIPETSEGVEGTFSEFWAEDANKAGTTFLPWTDDGFDLEALLGAAPDLIVAGGIGFPLMLAEKSYEQLSQIAPTVVVGKEYTDWRTQLAYLGEKVFDKADEVTALMKAYDDRVTEVKGAITPPPGPVAYVSVSADQRPFVLIESQGLPLDLQAVGIEPAPLFASGSYEPYTKGGDMFELSTEQAAQVLTQPTLLFSAFNNAPVDLPAFRAGQPWAQLPAITGGHAYDLPYWSLRPDYDEALATLDTVRELFAH